jgi:hypothetical protein
MQNKLCAIPMPLTDLKSVGQLLISHEVLSHRSAPFSIMKKKPEWLRRNAKNLPWHSANLAICNLPGLARFLRIR